jgi:hypothetical protein
MKNKEPRKLPSIINYEGKIWKVYNIPIGECHWLEISDQCRSVHIKINDESTETKDILSFQLEKKSTMYNALIEILTELRE